jgi:penicillin-binding protein 1B
MRWSDGRVRVALWLGAFVVVAIAALSVLADRLDALRAQRAVGPSWSFPSRVYSSGIPLVPGRVLPEPYLIAELRARGYREVAAEPPPGAYTRIAGGFEVGLRGLPDEPATVGGGGPERVRLRIEGGHLVGIERLGGFAGATPPDARPPSIEPALVSMVFDEQRVWRTWVSLERVPKHVQDAIVASEDRRFHDHLGIDPRGTMRALFTNMRTGEIREGGSTITQQLVRSLFVGRERTLLRKLSEIPLAVGTELLLSKHDILEMYLNSVYWGQAEGFSVGGVAEAARWYFSTPVESLSVQQGAMLAGIIPAPNAVNPFEKPALALQRRNRVLYDMVESRRLKRAVADRVATLPLGLRRGPTPVERFPSYTGYVASALDQRFRKHAITRFGLVVMTSMDLAWQIEAERSLSEGLASLDAGKTRRLQGAFVALDPATSAIVAMVGGRVPRRGDFNRAHQALRQTGSAIKPVIYAAAFSGPLRLTPATTVSDTVQTFGEGRWAWRPHNYDGSTHLDVTLAKALEKSLNIATANLVELIGARSCAEMAEQFGLGRLKAVASIGLGTNETSLLQLTNAYAVFRAEGMLRTPSAVQRVLDRDGREVLKADERAVEVIPPGVAALMTGLLQNVVRHGVAYPLGAIYGFDRPAAGKTGTTDDYKDAWFVGFTPDVVAGVWVGYDRPRSIGRPSAHTALPVWARVVKRMLEGFPPAPFETDSQLEWLDIDPWIGVLADSLCPSEKVPFMPGTGPYATCTDARFNSGYGYEYENPDSLYVRDSVWSDAEPESLPVLEGGDPGEGSVLPDTVEVAPQPPR